MRLVLPSSGRAPLCAPCPSLGGPSLPPTHHPCIHPVTVPLRSHSQEDVHAGYYDSRAEDHFHKRKSLSCDINKFHMYVRRELQLPGWG